MAEIRIETKTVSAPIYGDTGYDHLYLVFVDDDGNEYVVRAGPTYDFPPFGVLLVEANVAIENSEDARPIEDRAIHGSIVFSLNGQNPENVWDTILQAATQIMAANLSYDLAGTVQNSNSFVAAVLERVGIQVDAYLPLVPGDDNYGTENTLDQVVYNLIAATNTQDGKLLVHSDFFYGGNQADTLVGGGGADQLHGGAGDDILFGGIGTMLPDGTLDPASLTADDTRDILDGGSGNDIYKIYDSEYWAPTTPLSDIIQNLDQIIDSDGAGKVELFSASNILSITWRLGTAGYEDASGDSGYFFMFSGGYLVCTFGNNLGGYYGESIAYFVIDGSTQNLRAGFGGGAEAFAADSDGRFLGMTFLDLLNQVVGTVGGESLVGTASRDYIQGLAGDDTIDALDGDDFVEGGDGNDVIHGRLGADDLYGNIGNDQLFGESGDDDLRGGDGNDVLDGGIGADYMRGEAGNDTYIVDDVGDVVDEFSFPDSVDLVQASISIATLFDDIENLTLTGAAAINGTGNNLANIITGNSANNTLNGAGGNDTLIGGLGNDLYVVGAGDVIVEAAGAGTDTVQSAITWSIATTANVEYLVLTGSSAINGTGNDLNNVINGSVNTAANQLIGGLGYDTYIVGTGDVVVEAAGEGTDTVQSTITWSIAATANVENLTLLGSSAVNGTGNDLNNILNGSLNAAVNQLTGGLGNDTYVLGTGDIFVEAAGEGTDTIEIATSYSLAVAQAANIENLTLTGSSAVNGTGNDLNNTLNGSLNAAVNQLAGGLGNDIYVVGAGDVVIEAAGEGTDTVQSAITWSIATTANVEYLVLIGSSAINGTGNDLYNILNGSLNTAVNQMTGGLGNDLYVVGAGDVVVEAAGEGIDRVQSTITWSIAGTANVENLTLLGSSAVNGTGNDLNNTLDGSLNTAVNQLTGGLGNDIYVVGAGDVVVEAASAGTDTVQSAITWSIASAANVENLTLTGTSAINGTGNSLNNTISGNSSANTLNGAGGADTLTGGAGVDNLTGGAGSDRFVFAAGDSGQATGLIDAITDYAKGAAGTGDVFDFASAMTIGGSAAAATATQAAINATTGIASFAAGSGTILADALGDIAARFTASTDSAGEFALFRINGTGNYHLFISDGVAGVTANDLVIQLTSVTAISTINLTSGDLTILT